MGLSFYIVKLLSGAKLPYIKNIIIIHRESRKKMVNDTASVHRPDYILRPCLVHGTYGAKEPNKVGLLGAKCWLGLKIKKSLLRSLLGLLAYMGLGV